MNVDRLLVSEVVSWKEDPRGLHGIYRLHRGKLSFGDALRLFEDRCAIRADRFGWTGAREGARHLSIAGAPHLHPVPGARLELVGHARRPLEAKNHVANEFTVRVRDLTKVELGALPARIAAVARHGVPNYFDDRADALAGRDLVLGNRRGALEKVAAVDAPDDEQATEALEALPESVRSEVVRELQGHLWNRVVARYLRDVLGKRVRGDRPTHPWSAEDEAPALAAKVALPRAGARFAPPDLARAAATALAAEKLELSALSIGSPRGFTLARASRALLVKPDELRLEHSRPEPRRRSRFLARVVFKLPLESSPQPVLEHLFLSGRAAPRRAHSGRGA